MRVKPSVCTHYSDISAAKTYDWGKNDRIVSYPDGHSREVGYNEAYQDGLLGVTR
jgi:hypothetical protein